MRRWLRVVEGNGPPAPGETPEGVALDGRVLVAEGSCDEPDGLCFQYGETADLVWATYRGGGVRRGFLVGTRSGRTLRYGFVQIDAHGATVTGRGTAELELLDDGRLRLIEVWRSESGSERGWRLTEELCGWGAGA